MLKSQIDNKKNDFTIVTTCEHIEKVYAVIEASFKEYFDKLFGHDAKAVTSTFRNAFGKFREESKKYIDFFDEDAIQEFLDDDPRAFKAALQRECPIIHRCVYSQSEEMKDWKMIFRSSKSEELLDTFLNLMAFAKEYATNAESGNYSSIDRWEDFNLASLDEDRRYRVPGVIGTGIKSTVLYHHYPHIFPIRGRSGLYSLYFLTDGRDFDLPSETSEFLMIHDTHSIDTSDPDAHNYKMYHNWQYPYDLFTSYAMKIFRLIAKELENLDIHVSERHRYIYVQKFFDSVNELHYDHIRTMLGELEVIDA